MSPVEVWTQKILPRLEVAESGCWVFTGRTAGKGYGQVWMDKHRSTHRITAVVFLGLDLNDSTTNVCHRCDNPPCCNPAHLMLGSSSDNTRDAIAKGRRPALPPNALPKRVCAKGHDLAVTRRSKGKSGGSDCGVCRRQRHAEYMRIYRQRKKERAS